MNRRFERISPGRVFDTKTEKEYTCIIDSDLLRIINSICLENDKLLKTEEDMRCKNE